MSVSYKCKNDDSCIILAIDVGGSKFVIGYVETNGTILCQKRYTWGSDSRTPTIVVEEICSRIDQLKAIYPEWASRTIAAGMTLPGFVNTNDGIWVESDFMGAHNYPISEQMSKRIGIPVYADNDCKACALAERLYGAGGASDDFLYMTVSNGIGGSIYIDGLPYGGAFGHAGELGLFVMQENGRDSETDCSGVLETYASGRGFHQTYVEAGGNETDSEGNITGGLYISEKAAAGEQAALTTFSKQGYWLGRGLASALSLLDPGRVIVGGGLSMVFERYRYQLLATLRRCNPLYAIDPIPIEPTMLGYLGAFLGAAALALRGLGLCDPAPNPQIEKNDELVVSINSTVSSFLTIRGQKHHGIHGHGGDLAGLIVDDSSTLTLGEAISTRGMIRHWKETGGTSVSANSTLSDLIAAADSNDEKAQATLAKAGHYLGKAVAIECVLMDPQRVRIQGEFVRARHWFESSFLQTLQTETYYRGKLPFSILFE